MEPFSNNPAGLYRYLSKIANSQNYSVEIQLDMAWVFLKKPDFELIHFGDVSYRHEHLGKWITTFSHEMLIEEVIKLFPLIHDRKINLAKFTNPYSYLNKPAVIVIYCLDEDMAVQKEIQRFGWNVRWKTNLQTFQEKQRKMPGPEVFNE